MGAIIQYVPNLFGKIPKSDEWKEKLGKLISLLYIILVLLFSSILLWHTFSSATKVEYTINKPTLKDFAKYSDPVYSRKCICTKQRIKISTFLQQLSFTLKPFCEEVETIKQLIDNHVEINSRFTDGSLPNFGLENCYNISLCKSYFEGMKRFEATWHVFHSFKDMWTENKDKIENAWFYSEEAVSEARLNANMNQMVKNSVTQNQRLGAQIPLAFGRLSSFVADKKDSEYYLFFKMIGAAIGSPTLEEKMFVTKGKDIFDHKRPNWEYHDWLKTKIKVEDFNADDFQRFNDIFLKRNDWESYTPESVITWMDLFQRNTKNYFKIRDKQMKEEQDPTLFEILSSAGLQNYSVVVNHSRYWDQCQASTCTYSDFPKSMELLGVGGGMISMATVVIKGFSSSVLGFLLWYNAKGVGQTH